MADVKPASKKQDRQSQAVRDIKDIGKALENSRKEKGLTIEAVSKKTRIHINILKGLEDGTIENTMGKVYIRGFLKKYADFLAVDVADSLKVYAKTGSRTEAPQKLFIEPEDETEIDWDKYSPLIFTGVATILVLGLLVFGAVKAVKLMSGGMKKQTAVQQRVVPPHQKQGPASNLQNAVTLTIKTSEDVWVSLDADGSNEFRGILKKGKKETWDAQGQIRARVGKLEVLDFTVNGKTFSKLGNGVQDVTVDAKSIKVGKKSISTGA